MRKLGNKVTVACALAALVGFAGCVVLANIVRSRLAIEAELRADPARMLLHHDASIPASRPQLLVLGDSRAADLARQSIAPWTVVNRGVSGQTSAEVLARASRDLVLLAPDRALLVVGINDLKSNECESAVEQAAAAVEEVAQVASKLRVPLTIVAAWGASDVRSIRGMLLPSDLNSRVQRLNERFHSIATSHNASFLPVDFLLDDAGLVSAALAKDTLHLNDTGNELLAARISSSLPPTPAR
jgi:lysophospholipase L1-like esterase